MELNQTQTQKPPLAILAVGGFAVLFVLVVYTFLHEAGHALVGILFGQSLSNFDISFWDLSAHVRLSGTLTSAQRTIQIGAGAALPFLVWTLLISAAPRKGNVALELLKLVGSMAVVNSLLSWIILPILAYASRAPAGDDTPYLDLSHVGAGDSRSVVLHGEGYRSSGASSGTWQQRLQPGRYHLVLTAEESPGTLTVYWKLP